MGVIIVQKNVIQDNKMIKNILLIFTLLTFSLNYSQNVRCEDLMDFVKDNGYYKSSLSNYTLDSSWLYKVTAYDYEYKIYVIAEIKTREYSYTTNSYVFLQYSFTKLE